MKRLSLILGILLLGLLANGCKESDKDVETTASGTDTGGTDSSDTDSSKAGSWMTSWVSAQQLTDAKDVPSNPSLAGSTLRQVIYPSLGGDQLRITLSNAYGDAPITIVSSGVAISDGGKKIVVDSHMPLTFSGETSITIDKGKTATSDPIDFKVTAFENLAISMSFDDSPIEAVTGHPGSRTSSFIAEGNVIEDESLGGLGIQHWYFLSALDVMTTPDAHSIVILGDSITDGKGSTTNENNRWPNLLDKRLKESSETENIAVLNQGIGGNCITKKCLGPSFVNRFESDVLGPIGVKQLIVFGGINDLNSSIPSQRIIDDLTSIAEEAHDAEIEVIGATITPCEGHSYFNDTLEKKRQDINDWIRATDSFDAVIDFDAITRDPKTPTKLRSDISGDGLHPSAEGYQIMANEIDLTLFEI